MLYIKKIIDFIKKKSKSEEINNISPVGTKPKDETNELELVNYNNFISMEKINNDKKNILIVDDLPTVKILFQLDFKNINKKYNKNIEDDFNVYYCISQDCGYVAYKAICIDEIKFDIAFLDLTLGYSYKVSDDIEVEIDGIDLAIELLKRNPEIVIIFSTSSVLNNENRYMRYFIKKFYEHTGVTLSNSSSMYMNKNSDRVNKIFKSLYGDEEGNNGS